MDDSGFPRTPDRSVKLLGTCVRYPRSVETSMGARGPDFLGGSATFWYGYVCMLACVYGAYLIVGLSYCRVD